MQRFGIKPTTFESPELSPHCLRYSHHKLIWVMAGLQDVWQIWRTLFNTILDVAHELKHFFECKENAKAISNYWLNCLRQWNLYFFREKVQNPREHLSCFVLHVGTQCCGGHFPSTFCPFLAPTMCICVFVACKLLRGDIQYIMILCYKKKESSPSTSERNTVARWPITNRVCLLILPCSVSTFCYFLCAIVMKYASANICCLWNKDSQQLYMKELQLFHIIFPIF